MVGTLAQLIALVSNGNAYLGACDDLQNFYPNNSTFKFCNSIIFVDMKKFLRVTETRVANNPCEWLSWLKHHYCRRLYLRYAATHDPQLPDHLSVAFAGGGGTWYVVSAFPNSVDYWLNRWEVTDRNAPDKKIWTVTYRRVATQKPKLETLINDLSPCKKRFESVLKQVEAFAARNDLDYFAQCFQNGLEALASDNPMILYHEDLLPDVGFSLEAKQLIAAASAAWVFGGMGSWNDLGFDGEEQNEYERLSKELYAIINLSIERSVNSYR